MALEMDSFLIKFKNLWKSGRNANLTIKSNAGKAEVVLIVELDEPIHQTQHPHHQRSRNVLAVMNSMKIKLRNLRKNSANTLI